MASFWDEMKSSSSYQTLVRAIDAAPTPTNFINKLMDMSHPTRVIKDGLTEGTAETIGYALGLPQTLYKFWKEHVDGERLKEAPDKQKYSPEWFKGKMMGEYEDNLEILGKSRPKLRPGSYDGYIHAGASFVPLIGSAFIPGGQVAGASKVGQVLSFAAPKLGAIGFATTTATESYELAEDYFDFGAATQELVGFGLPNKPTASPQNSLIPKLTGNKDRGSVIPVAESEPPATTSPSNSHAVILGLTVGTTLQKDGGPATFDGEKTTLLQTELANMGHYTHKIDGIAGKHTMSGLNQAIKEIVNPASLSNDIKSMYKDKMVELAKDLRNNPPSEYAYDPRVTAFQVCGYALGLYNKKIDGLMGPSSITAAHLIENKDLSVNGAQVATNTPSQTPKVEMITLAP
ncbi:MAG: hypothetical protein RBR86_03730 [Pseudobdellovibrionaceae bacterium]|jgi:hypothetical protein|nr:hypothetical protein [Pseudobdellovibrionaceae bacterium]